MLYGILTLFASLIYPPKTFIIKVGFRNLDCDFLFFFLLSYLLFLFMSMLLKVWIEVPIVLSCEKDLGRLWLFIYVFYFLGARIL